MHHTDFINRLKALHFIDRDQLPELRDHQWQQFRDKPVDFLIRADDKCARAIMREVERSQQRPRLTPIAG